MSTTCRVAGRSVTAEKRSSIPDEIHMFEESDRIPLDFSAFSTELTMKKYDVHIIHNNGSIHLLKFDDTFREVTSSVNINPDFSVTAWRNNTKVSIRHLLGFQWKLERWSQLENIISSVSNFPLDLSSELQSVNKIKQRLLSDNIDITKCKFLFEQFLLKSVKPKGRRYSAQSMVYSFESIFAQQILLQRTTKIHMPSSSTDITIKYWEYKH